MTRVRRNQRIPLVVGLLMILGGAMLGVSGPRTITASAVACTPLFSDQSADSPAGTPSAQADNLDVVQFDMGLANSGATLRTAMTIKNLSKTLPSGRTVMGYTMYWTFGGTIYATSADVDSTGTVTYTSGTLTVVNNSPTYSGVNTVTGSFGSGPNGIVEIDAPLSGVGAPPPGSTLTGTHAYTGASAGAGGISAGQISDSDGPGLNYTLGQAKLPRPAGSQPVADGDPKSEPLCKYRAQPLQREHRGARRSSTMRSLSLSLTRRTTRPPGCASSSASPQSVPTGRQGRRCTRAT